MILAAVVCNGSCYNMKQKGMGLIEILISLCLGSIMITALMHHYLSIKKYYFQAQSRLQVGYELQRVEDLVRHSVRQAGFTPCVSLNHLITLDRCDGQQNLQGVQASKKTLQVNRMSEHFNQVLNIIGPTKLLTSNASTLHTQYPVLIADCYHAEVHRVTRITFHGQDQEITLSQPLAYTYQQPIYIGTWLQEIFYIRQKNEKNSALFYRLQHADQLTEEVQDMHVQIKNYPPYTLINLIFALRNEQTVVLETRVRAS